MKKLPAIILLAFTAALQAQVNNPGMVNVYDSLEQGKVTVGGYIDAYYAFDFNRPASSDRPYFVSSARHNEMNINLAYADIRYINRNIRAHFVPGFGTYMVANYSSEPSGLRYFVEANAGLKLSKKKDIWVDAGVLPSPYTNESAISKDHLMYTRSMAAENVPYFLSGVKLSVPVSSKMSAYIYVINGWQNISETNKQKSFGSQLEYRPGKTLLLNWDTYIGDESSAARPDFRMRYFSDLYLVYKPKGKFSATACIYGGQQHRTDSAGAQYRHGWWQMNLIGDYRLNSKVSVSARAEYFEDLHAIMVNTPQSAQGFSAFSGSAGLNVKAGKNALFRLEDRLFVSSKQVYLNPEGKPSKFSNVLSVSLAVWF